MSEFTPSQLSLDPLPGPLRGGVLTIGNFDGVHLAHQRLLQECQRWAASAPGPVIAMTFEPHPVQILRPDLAPRRLTTVEEKIRLLKEHGAAHVLVAPTDAGLLDLDAEEFIRSVIVAKLAPSHIVEGDNFRFGKGRGGGTATLAAAASRYGFHVHIVDPVTILVPPEENADEVKGAGEGSTPSGSLTCVLEHGSPVASGKPGRPREAKVSSSLIRDCLNAGRVEMAALALGRFYSFRGEVVLGRRRGRRLGFPTANLRPEEVLIPAPAVYSGVAMVADSRFPAAISIGDNPTFGGEELQIEAHLIGFHGDLYGARIRLEFQRRLRSQRRFASAEALVEQLKQDVARVAANAALEPKPASATGI